MFEFLKKGFKTLKFKKNKPSPFGELEEKIMEVLWKRGSGTVREVRASLKEDLAHTTVMTILDRLYKKGYLTRDKEGKGYRYFPVVSKEEFEKIITQKVLSDLIKSNPEATIAAFEGTVENLSKDELRKLKEIIERKAKDEEK
jgi:predicted transcriptional regulator